MRGVLKLSLASVSGAFCFLLVWLGGVSLICLCTFPFYEDLEALLVWWRYPGWGVLLAVAVLACRLWKVSPRLRVVWEWKGLSAVVGAALLYWVVSFVISHWSALRTGTLYFAVGITEKNVLFAVEALLLAPFIEEFAFRGVVLEYLRRANGVVVAVLWSSVLFSLYHMTPSQFLPAFFAGIFFSVLYLCTKSLPYVVIAHFVYNLACFFIWIK